MNSRSTRKDARLQSRPLGRVNILLFGHIAVSSIAEGHHEPYVGTTSESIAPYPQVSSTPRSASCDGQRGGYYMISVLTMIRPGVA